MSKLIKTDAEWRLQLSDLAYKVTRKHGTEPPFSNDNFPKSAGIFICKCCEENLFDANSKFDSGTGWPSFYAPIDENAVALSTDFKLVFNGSVDSFL